MQTVAAQCRDALVAGIQSLGLRGIASDEVAARDRPSDNSTMPRGISVVADRELEGAGTNERDDYGYVFGVYFSRGTSKGWDDLTDTLADWRRQVRIKFNNKRLDGVDRVYMVAVRSGDYLSDKAWKDNRAISALSIICWSREPREEVE